MFNGQQQYVAVSRFKNSTTVFIHNEAGIELKEHKGVQIKDNNNRLHKDFAAAVSYFRQFGYNIKSVRIQTASNKAKLYDAMIKDAPQTGKYDIYPWYEITAEYEGREFKIGPMCNEKCCDPEYDSPDIASERAVCDIIGSLAYNPIMQESVLFILAHSRT